MLGQHKQSAELEYSISPIMNGHILILSWPSFCLARRSRRQRPYKASVDHDFKVWFFYDANSSSLKVALRHNQIRSVAKR